MFKSKAVLFGLALAVAGARTVLGTSAEAETAAPNSPRSGYWTLTADGHVTAFGDAPALGGPAATTRSIRAVDLEPVSKGDGYWILDERGVVHVYGTARHFGDLGRAGLQPGETATSLSGAP